jgi:ADP-heptose:LPS heptosyltransferase
MRVLDRTVGAWLCRLLGLVLWVLRRHVRRVDHPLSPVPETVREILVLKFLGLGSILQATPLFAALRRRYPQARIRLLTFRAHRPLRDLQIGVDAVETVDPSSLWRFLRSHIRALWRLRRTRFDLLLNLEFYATYAAVITALLSKRFAIAFGGFAHHRDRFFHDFVSYDSGPHVQQKFMSFARRLGYAGPTPPLARLHVSQPASVMAKIESREGFRLEREDCCLLVNINTSPMATNRRWPLENYKAVVDRLALQPKVRCILIGGPEDRAAVEDFQARLAGRTGWSTWPAN